MPIDDEEIGDAQIVEGGLDASLKLRQWLGPLLAGPEVEGDVRCTLHQKSKMGEKEIDIFIFEPGAGVSVDAFIKEIIDVAETDASEMMGKISYAVRADQRAGRCAFTLKVPVREGTDDEDFPEMPNGKGLVHQSQRHTEVMFKETISAIRMFGNFMRDEHRALREENTFLKRHQHEQIKVTEQVRSMEFSRRIKIEEIEEQKANRKEMMGMAKKILPVVAAKILGGGSQVAADLAGGSTPIDGILDGMISSLEGKPEKYQALMEILDPADVAAIGEIHKYVAYMRQRGKAPPQAPPAAEVPEEPG